MFNFDLKISKNSSDSKLILSLPIQYYIIVGLITSIIGGSIIYSGYSMLSLIILILSFVVTTYRESWIFDKSKNQINYITGVGFIYIKRNYKIDNIDSIELKKLKKGNKNNITNNKEDKKDFLKPKFYSLEIFFKNGVQKTVLTSHEREKDTIYTICKELELITNFIIIN